MRVIELFCSRVYKIVAELQSNCLLRKVKVKEGRKFKCRSFNDAHNTIVYVLILTVIQCLYVTYDYTQTYKKC